jgi:hypothetical protein
MCEETLIAWSRIRKHRGWLAHLHRPSMEVATR